MSARPSPDAAWSAAPRHAPPAGSAPAARAASLARLAAERFDLLVVGGGITGAGIARDAAERGLRVALVERDDFASGTSSRSSRLVHGGVRYLEHGHLGLVFEASRERRTLLRIAPHLVRPLAFTWPVYRGARVPRWKLGAGLLLYDALALFRNVGRHRRLAADEVLAREPALRREGLRGGATYWDAATDDTRLTLANALAAAEAGATVVNHVEVCRILREGGRAHGAVVRDALDGAEIVVAARVVVNAAGPWGDAVRRLDDPGAPAAVRGSKGVHVAVPRARLGNLGAVTLLSAVDGRVMFVLPAGALAIVGTTDTYTTAPPDQVRASEADVDYLVASANAFFPEARLERADVVSAWAGIRPLVAAGAGDRTASASREHAIARSASGVVSVSGGKLTTYRAMAAQVVDVAHEALAGAPRAAPTDARPLPGGDLGSYEEALASARTAIGRADVAERLVQAYGDRWRGVWALARADAALAEPLVEGLPYLRAEVVHAVEHELACTLADVLIRRMHVAYETRDGGRAAAAVAAPVMAARLGWTEAQTRRQLEAYAHDASRLFGVDVA